MRLSDDRLHVSLAHSRCVADRPRRDATRDLGWRGRASVARAIEHSGMRSMRSMYTPSSSWDATCSSRGATPSTTFSPLGRKPEYGQARGLRDTFRVHSPQSCHPRARAVRAVAAAVSLPSPDVRAHSEGRRRLQARSTDPLLAPGHSSPASSSRMSAPPVRYHSGPRKPRPHRNSSSGHPRTC